MRYRLHMRLFRLIDQWGDRICESRLGNFGPAYLDWLGRPLCLLLGHVPAMDHCGRPEHDYCHYCNTIMPGQARERKGRTP